MTILVFGSSALFDATTGAFTNPFVDGVLFDTDTDTTLNHDDAVQFGIPLNGAPGDLTFIGSQTLGGEAVAVFGSPTDPNTLLVVSPNSGVDFSGETLTLPLPEDPFTFPPPAAGTTFAYDTLIAIDVSNPLAPELIDGGGGTPVVTDASYFALPTPLPVPGVLNAGDGTLGASQVTWIEGPAGDFVPGATFGAAEIGGTFYPIITFGIGNYAIAVPSSVDTSGLSIGDTPEAFLGVDYDISGFDAPTFGQTYTFDNMLAMTQVPNDFADAGDGTPVMFDGGTFAAGDEPLVGYPTSGGTLVDLDGTLTDGEFLEIINPDGSSSSYEYAGYVTIGGTDYPVIDLGFNAFAALVPSDVVGSVGVGSDAPVVPESLTLTIPVEFDATHLSEITGSGFSTAFGPVTGPFAPVTLSPSDNEFNVGDTFSTGPFGTLTYQGTVSVNGVTGLAFTDTGGATAVLFQQDPGDLTGQIPIVDPVPSTVCFAAGTMIATPEGETTVETLQIGDLITTADGRTVPVKWIGRQTLVAAFAGERARPVRVAAGALGDGLPHTDLVLTADHALILDGLAINAGALVNGTTITLDPAPQRATYYHVETEDHDIILANGAAAETFVDYVGRQAFDNHAEYIALYGDERIITEMPLPRISTARLLPPALKARLAGRHAA